MASIWLPSAGDQENRIRLPGTTKGKAFNKLAPRGSNFSKKVSATPLKLLPCPPQQQSNTGRTFGDISNLLTDRGAVVTPARSGKSLKKGLSSMKKPASLKKPQQPDPVANHLTKIVQLPKEPGEIELDFFPIISEIEDYSDVLPKSFLLERQNLQRLVEERQLLQKAPRPLSPLRSQSPSPSPSRLLLDDFCDMPEQRLLQPCDLQAAEQFSELQVMPVDW